MTINKRLKIIFGVLFTFAIWFVNMGVASPGQTKTIHIIFRLDDYSSRSNTAMELKVIDEFKKYQLPCVFSVIPFHKTEKTGEPIGGEVPLTLAKASILENIVARGMLQVALHGYAHRRIPKRNLKHSDEFSGLSYMEQLKKIRDGKKYLEKITGLTLFAFVPPYNGYDRNTLKALEATGFDTISADIFGVVDKYSKLHFVPFTANLIQLRNAVELARNSSDPHALITVLFHLPDFLELEDAGGRGKLTFQDFDALLSWVKSQKDLRVVTFDQAIQSNLDLSASHFVLYKRFFKIYSLVPSFFHRSLRGVYFSKEVLSGLWVWACLYALGYLLSLFVVFFALTSIIGTKLRDVFKVKIYFIRNGSVVLVTLVLFYVGVIHHGSFGCITATVSIALLAICFGFWNSFRKVHA